MKTAQDKLGEQEKDEKVQVAKETKEKVVTSTQVVKKGSRQKKKVQSQPVEAAPKEESKRPGSKKVVPLVYKRGVRNPAVEHLTELSQQRDGTAASTDTSCCVICTNAEIMRLFRSNQYKQALALVQSKDKISSLV